MSEAFDPFTVEIVKEKLAAAADEMGVVLARTSMSPIVYEVLDFACGITDAQARVVAQTNGLTLFTGTFGPQVESIVDRVGIDGMREGDVFATNIPYVGYSLRCPSMLSARQELGGCTAGSGATKARAAWLSGSGGTRREVGVLDAAGRAALEEPEPC